MSWWTDITGFVERRWQIDSAFKTLESANSSIEVKRLFDSLSAEQRADPGVIAHGNRLVKNWKFIEGDTVNPLAKWLEGALADWLATIKKYETTDPEQAKKNLTAMTADVMTIAAASAAVDIGLGMLPNSAGTASAANTKQILAWLGLGAVITAVAHDPVKIGLLRPYQDSLEMTFRNRRPGDMQLFQAYRTRELTATKATDLSALDDALMDQIEAENQTYYDREIAKWGYSVDFAGALARSATRTLNFSQLSALARQGLLTRGLAIYSLWGEGLDRAVMRPALDALLQQNEIASYDGFRAQIERGYVDGLVTEEELTAYYAKLHIPADVQKIMLPHMTRLRAEAKKKAELAAAGPQRDLTVSQVQQAYENELIKGSEASNMILDLGYSTAEAAILMTIAEKRRKVPGATKLKRLPLTDYEKAYINKLISKDDVLARMKGEYTAEDIALEKKLLEAGKA